MVESGSAISRALNAVRLRAPNYRTLPVYVRAGNNLRAPPVSQSDAAHAGCLPQPERPEEATMNDDKMPDRAPARMDAGHGDDLGNPPGDLTGHGKARHRSVS